MANRFYCTIHQAPMTGSHIGDCGVVIRRCKLCIAEARAIVRARRAEFRAATRKGKGSRARLYAQAKIHVWRGPKATAEQISTG
jgi:hypothetical protein